MTKESILQTEGSSYRVSYILLWILEKMRMSKYNNWWFSKTWKNADKNRNVEDNFHGNCCNLLFILYKKTGLRSRTLTYLTTIYILPDYKPPTHIYMMAQRKRQVLMMNNVRNILHCIDESFVKYNLNEQKPVSGKLL